MIHNYGMKVFITIREQVKRSLHPPLPAAHGVLALLFTEKIHSKSVAMQNSRRLIWLKLHAATWKSFRSVREKDWRNFEEWKITVLCLGKTRDEQMCYFLVSSDFPLWT